MKYDAHGTSPIRQKDVEIGPPDVMLTFVGPPLLLPDLVMSVRFQNKLMGMKLRDEVFESFSRAPVTRPRSGREGGRPGEAALCTGACGLVLTYFPRLINQLMLCPVQSAAAAAAAAAAAVSAVSRRLPQRASRAPGSAMTSPGGVVIGRPP